MVVAAWTASTTAGAAVVQPTMGVGCSVGGAQIVTDRPVVAADGVRVIVDNSAGAAAIALTDKRGVRTVHMLTTERAFVDSELVPGIVSVTCLDSTRRPIGQQASTVIGDPEHFYAWRTMACERSRMVSPSPHPVVPAVWIGGQTRFLTNGLRVDDMSRRGGYRGANERSWTIWRGGRVIMRADLSVSLVIST